jgi:hypothetical protein
MSSRIVVTGGVVLGLAALLLAGAAATRGDEEDQALELMRVPAAVTAAAAKAVEGFEAREAEVEAILVYELEGSADGKTYEIEVTGEGHVLESETEADDDPDGTDDDANGSDDKDDNDDGGDAEDDSEHELDIPLTAVPQKVRAAAEKAVPGVKLSEASVESVLAYELTGTAQGKRYEIEVTSEGQVLETEQAAEDD